MDGKKKRPDSGDDIAPPASSRSDAEWFEALQQKYFGDRVLPGSGADFIREAREARDARLDGQG